LAQVTQVAEGTGFWGARGPAPVRLSCACLIT